MGRVRLLPLICMMAALMVFGNIHASETEGFTEIKQGDKGDQVKEVQELLSKLVYMPSAIDGDFGVKTEQAVVDFQKSVGSETTGRNCVTAGRIYITNCIQQSFSLWHKQRFIRWDRRR